MARQEINLGTAPTGVGGDTTRSTGVKVNAMTTELYGRTDNLKSAAYAAMVGTVSQSGGLPTGAIIETGSNANGTYIKYADGTLICRVSATASPYAINLSVNASLFVSNGVGFTFPVAFTGFPSIDPFAVSATGYFVWACIEGSASSSAFAMRLMSPVSTATSFAGYIAIGRWF